MMKLSLLLALLSSETVIAFHTSSFQTRVSLQQIDSVKRRNHESSALNYSPNDDPQLPSNGGVWTALQLTEKWISAVLGDPSAKTGRVEPKSNPYARKEVSYSCEMTDQTIMAVAGIFRRLKEAREMGEEHARCEKELIEDRGYQYIPGTMRQTLVLVVPFCKYFNQFTRYEKVIQAINQARKNTLDLMTEAAFEKLLEQSDDEEWDVSVNAASLHPKYGKKSAGDILAEMKMQDAVGEVDVNAEENADRKDQARRSPYPSLVIEVKSTPPGEVNLTTGQTEISYTENLVEEIQEQSASKDTIVTLEKLFAKSAQLRASEEPENEDAFYKAIGKVSNIEEILPNSPIVTSRNWIANEDIMYDPHISTFTSSDAKHADAAFEFVFSSLAIQSYNPKRALKRKEFNFGSRSYLVMPHFSTSSATSMAVFTRNVEGIIGSIDGLKNRVSVIDYHPEHMNVERRAPVPLIVLQWYHEGGKSS